MISIFLLDFGGPENKGDVRPFLKNLFSDELIFPFPFGQAIFADIISRFRSARIEKQYAAIGGGSPLPEQSRQIVRQLQENFSRANLDVQVSVGMRYSEPSIPNSLKKILAEKPRGIVVIPMFPHYSTATTLSVFKTFRETYATLQCAVPFQLVDWWYGNTHFIAGWCYSIKKALDQFHAARRDTIPILFTAHSLPESFVKERRDPYPQQIRECCETIIKYLGGNHEAFIAYQSKVGPVEWMKPATIDFIQELGKRGVKELVVVPISFITDHIETLYEIDQEILPKGKSAGIEKIIRCEALFYGPYLVKALEEIALKKIPPLLNQVKSISPAL